MPRFAGAVAIKYPAEEVAPGIFKEPIREEDVVGEIIILPVRWVNADRQETVSSGHTISFIAPEEKMYDFSKAIYAVWHGRKWAVVNVSYNHPKLSLKLGELYNG